MDNIRSKVGLKEDVLMSGGLLDVENIVLVMWAWPNAIKSDLRLRFL